MGFNNLFSTVFLVMCTVLNTKAHIEHVTGDNNYQLITHLASPTTIEFILTVKTTGWIGIGVGPNPNMMGADLAIVTEINETHAVVRDFHNIEDGRPVADTKESSDWLSFFYERNETTRKVIIQRLLKTTDPNAGQDLEITETPVYVVWAYGATDDLDEHVAKGSIPAKVNLLAAEGPSDPSTSPDPKTSPTTTPGGVSDLKGPAAFVLGTFLLALVKFI